MGFKLKIQWYGVHDQKKFGDHRSTEWQREFGSVWELYKLVSTAGLFPGGTNSDLCKFSSKPLHMAINLLVGLFFSAGIQQKLCKSSYPTVNTLI